MQSRDGTDEYMPYTPLVEDPNGELLLHSDVLVALNLIEAKLTELAKPWPPEDLK